MNLQFQNIHDPTPPNLAHFPPLLRRVIQMACPDRIGRLLLLHLPAIIEASC